MMTLNSAPDCLMKCMHKYQLHTQGEQKPNSSSEHDTTGQPGDKMLKDMYGIAQNVGELRTLEIMFQGFFNLYPLLSAPGNIYLWTSVPFQLTRMDMTLH